MPSTMDLATLTTFPAIYTYLTTTYPFPVLPLTSPNPHSKPLSHAIASLSLHPTLEALLHILNADLSSAHFLCRHMQNAPAWEGMYIHGLLHRVEGDYRNAEAWYTDISKAEVFQCVWPEGLEEAKDFIQRVERLRKQEFGSREDLEKESGREFERIMEWCQERFGKERLEDATTAWTEPSEKHRAIAAKMIVGGEGWRHF